MMASPYLLLCKTFTIEVYFSSCKVIFLFRQRTKIGRSLFVGIFTVGANSEGRQVNKNWIPLA